MVSGYHIGQYSFRLCCGGVYQNSPEALLKHGLLGATPSWAGLGSEDLPLPWVPR